MKRNTVYVLINFFAMSAAAVAFIIEKNYVIGGTCLFTAQLWLIADYIKTNNKKELV